MFRRFKLKNEKYFHCFIVRFYRIYFQGRTYGRVSRQKWPQHFLILCPKLMEQNNPIYYMMSKTKTVFCHETTTKWSHNSFKSKRRKPTVSSITNLHHHSDSGWVGWINCCDNVDSNKKPKARSYGDLEFIYVLVLRIVVLSSPIFYRLKWWSS